MYLHSVVSIVSNCKHTVVPEGDVDGGVERTFRFAVPPKRELSATVDKANQLNSVVAGVCNRNGVVFADRNALGRVELTQPVSICPDRLDKFTFACKNLQSVVVCISSYGAPNSSSKTLTPIDAVPSA